MRVARPVVLDKGDQEALEQLARGRSLPARLVERARIVLRVAGGLQDQQVASELGITPEKLRDGATVIWMGESAHSKEMHRDPAGRARSTRPAPPK